MSNSGSSIPWRERVLVPINFASEIIGVSRSTIYRLQADGKLVFKRIGGKTLVTVASLTHLLDNPDDWTPKSK